MDKIQYKAIRGERDFLYRYFIKCGGANLEQRQFEVYLSHWFLSIGVAPQIGKNIIVRFLDKKFG